MSLHCDPYRRRCLLAVFHFARPLTTVLGQISMENSRVSQLYYSLAMTGCGSHVQYASHVTRVTQAHQI